MDCKITGVSREIMATAMEQARAGRLHILAEMAKTIAEPRDDLSEYAPRITTVHITKSEMGQHVGTALAQSVAEELEVDWNDVRIDYPSSHEKWGLMITGGSWSVNWTFDALSRAGASGRIALTGAGAAMMGVAAGECSAKNSAVTHSGTGQSVTYAEIISGGNISRTFSEDELKEIQLKAFGEYSLVGVTGVIATPPVSAKLATG